MTGMLRVENNNSHSPLQKYKKSKIPKKKIEAEMLKKFKQHMINKDFFARLKLIMFEIDKEL